MSEESSRMENPRCQTPLLPSPLRYILLCTCERKAGQAPPLLHDLWPHRALPRPRPAPGPGGVFSARKNHEDLRWNFLLCQLSPLLFFFPFLESLSSLRTFLVKSEEPLQNTKEKAKISKRKRKLTCASEKEEPQRASKRFKRYSTSFASREIQILK